MTDDEKRAHDENMRQINEACALDRERREAWDRYAAAYLARPSGGHTMADLAAKAVSYADAMLADRDERFPR